jgi:hypothetical protein
MKQNIQSLELKDICETELNRLMIDIKAELTRRVNKIDVVPLKTLQSLIKEYKTLKNIKPICLNCKLKVSLREDHGASIVDGYGFYTLKGEEIYDVEEDAYYLFPEIRKLIKEHEIKIKTFYKKLTNLERKYNLKDNTISDWLDEIKKKL